ncbi:MAG: hypothetical protein OXI27_06145 [Thaumarchaeota archaeon]|nr:hypothetical protein [Nitrososphaerota archaeon]
MNLTDMLAEVDVVLQSAILAVVDIVIWVGAAVLLAVIVIGAIRLIGRMAGLPTEKIFECARAVMERKLEQVKENKGGKQEPFRLDMLGIKIRAEGLTGKIIFMTLLGSIAAAGASINGLWLDWMVASEAP